MVWDGWLHVQQVEIISRDEVGGGNDAESIVFRFILDYLRYLTRYCRSLLY